MHADSHLLAMVGASTVAMSLLVHLNSYSVDHLFVRDPPPLFMAHLMGRLVITIMLSF